MIDIDNFHKKTYVTEFEDLLFKMVVEFNLHPENPILQSDKEFILCPESINHPNLDRIINGMKLKYLEAKKRRVSRDRSN